MGICCYAVGSYLNSWREHTELLYNILLREKVYDNAIFVKKFFVLFCYLLSHQLINSVN